MSDCGFNFQTRYTELPGVFFSRLSPARVAAPEVVVVNDELACALGLDFSGLGGEELAAMFAGQELPVGAEPFAQAYAGHQFGAFTVLGDGRALLWGEHVSPDGRRFDLQFKGSGRTPYSRRGDGRAALGPMLREYLISEAMYHLGVPTTRSLAVVRTGEAVLREVSLPGAILTRVASSHLRVGTFEYAAACGDESLVRVLMDYTVERHFPELRGVREVALELLRAVMERQADLVVEWMRVGFVHGVMNSDNMALSGETIDYGPFDFLDGYDPGTVFSSIDYGGRYAFGNQPRVVQWNLARLAEALLPLIDGERERALELAKEVIYAYPALYEGKWLAMMRSKLGLEGEGEGDVALVDDLLSWMEGCEADYTNTFRDLGRGGFPVGELYEGAVFRDWYGRWQARLGENAGGGCSARELMRASNPEVIPRNHKVEEALEAAVRGEMGLFREALLVFQDPYAGCGSGAGGCGRGSFQEPAPPGAGVYRTFCGT